MAGDVPVYVNENSPKLVEYPVEIGSVEPGESPETKRYVRLMQKSYYQGFYRGSKAGLAERGRNPPPDATPAEAPTDSASTDPADEDDGDSVSAKGKGAADYREVAGVRTLVTASGDSVTDARGSGGAVRLQGGRKGVRAVAGASKVLVGDGEDRVHVEGATVNAVGESVNLGETGLSSQDGVVTGQATDTLTGLPFWMLGAASTVVKAKR